MTITPAVAALARVERCVSAIERAIQEWSAADIDTTPDLIASIEAATKAYRDAERADMPCVSSTSDAVHALAQRVVDRVLAVYRDDYIERMDREEPESLIGLTKQLQRALVTPARR